MGLRAQLLSIVKGRLAGWSQLLPVIAGYEPELKALDEYQLRKRSLSLRFRARSGEPLAHLLPEAYALVREAGRRTLNMRHFEVQMLGGIAMFHHSIVEMETGEGKTLTATLPMYLYALAGKGCHLATVNDYLARRDAEWMGPIYQALGLTVGVIEQPMQLPSGPRPMRPTSPTARPRSSASTFSAIGSCCGGSAKARPTCWAACSATASRAPTRSPCSATRTSPWSTRPTASSSTKPARR